MSRISMCVDGRGITAGLATLSIVPPIPCFYYVKIMSLKNQGGIINIGTYNDNSREYNIDARGKDLSSIMSSIEVEDIVPSSSVSSECHSDNSCSFFCRITKAAYDAGKAPLVEKELRSACVSAPKLIKTIRTNEALGYLDTQNLSSKELYELLDEHFGLTFKQRNFDTYRSK